MKTSKKTSRKRTAQRRCAVAPGSPQKAIGFNINEYFRVKLTPRGKAIHRAQHDELNANYPTARLLYRAPKEDANGWSEWQAWSLMQTFGAHIVMGFDPPFETNIEILVNIRDVPQAQNL
jgi:hypothetical protein